MQTAGQLVRGAVVPVEHGNRETLHCCPLHSRAPIPEGSAAKLVLLPEDEQLSRELELAIGASMCATPSVTSISR